MLEAGLSHKKTSLLTARNYRLLWLGQAFSLIGDYFFSATLTLWIIGQLARGQDWLPLAVGGVSIVTTLPSLLLAPLAGVFIDRWNRRMTLIWTDLLRLLLVTLFLLLTLLTDNHIFLLMSCFVILLFVACGSQFFYPAREAVVADMVAPEQYAQAYGSLQQGRYLAQILGPSLAAPLYLALGPIWAIALNAGSFLVSCLVLLALRLSTADKAPSPTRAGFWQEFQEGQHFFRKNRILVTLLISGMIYMSGGMAYNSFEYLYGVENLHIPAALLGIYVAAYGVGVVSGMPLAAALARRISEVAVLWIFLVCSGITVIILSRVTSLIPGMICGFLIGVFGSSIFIAVRPLTILVTPRNLLGRVMAVEMPLITLASVAGGLIASLLASTLLSHFHVTLAGLSFGRLDTIFIGVGLLTIGAGLFARFTLYNEVKAVRARLTEQESRT